MPPQKVRITKKREFRPHGEHMHAARLFYRHAKDGVKGPYYQWSACLAFSAFSLEAYLNLLGQRTIVLWRDVEKAPPLAKLRLLMAQFGIRLQTGERPLQTVRELFMYRNWLAHTRSEIILYDAEHPIDEHEERLYEAPLHKWERFPTDATAARAMEDVEKVITLLNARSPYPEPLPMSLSWHSGGSSIEEDA
jgi:hypothetical protein